MQTLKKCEPLFRMEGHNFDQFCLHPYFFLGGGCFCEWKDFVVQTGHLMRICVFLPQGLTVCFHKAAGIGGEENKTSANAIPARGCNVIVRRDIIQKMTGSFGQRERLQCSPTLKPHIPSIHHWSQRKWHFHAFFFPIMFDIL